MTATESEIERLSQRRRDVWAGAPEEEPDEAKRIAVKLEALYALRREDTCERVAGRPREEIQRTAKVETELDKLATPPRLPAP